MNTSVYGTWKINSTNMYNNKPILGNLWLQIVRKKNILHFFSLIPAWILHGFLFSGSKHRGQMLRMAGEKRRRAGSRDSACSSVEPSMSSFTNGTHSSLNSEVEDEELACSVEPSVHFSTCMHSNGSCMCICKIGRAHV